MPRPALKPQDEIVESWEITIPGSVYVWVYDRRDDRYKKQRVGGKTGSRRLHITRDDRKYNQELTPLENKGCDPFTNGALKLVEAADRDDNLEIRYHLNDDELGQMFEVRDVALFTEAIRDIESELVLRRLQAMGEIRGTVAQNNALKEYVDEKYPIGGTQKTVREMIEAGERIGASRI